MADINTITTLNKQSVVSKLIIEDTQIKQNEMYQRIDKVIFACIGQSMTFDALLQHIKISDLAAYEYVIGYAQQILKPTYALS